MLEIVRKILKVFEENNLWDEGIELIGSWCFTLYQKTLKFLHDSISSEPSGCPSVLRPLRGEPIQGEPLTRFRNRKILQEVKKYKLGELHDGK